jgi:Zn-dependent protease with chaperone function
MSHQVYPLPPAHISAEKLLPSPAFRKQAVKVIIAILLFLLTYIVLLGIGVALAIACCYAGISLVIFLPKFITILLGLGLVALGISVLFFLVKFVFTVSKDENPARVEITEDEQPQLFAFIRRLTEDTNTRFPGKIFISPDVNACVFYHSSFWSMFLPVRKNLEIGLGLVNSINISEFKAVMAHEFGHFSQRSMKLGSFTYSANRIIYNMLYDNDGYTKFLQSWGQIHVIVALFMQLTIKIAQGIQWILRGMYKLINKSYMALSREMEFHADTIAASVAGGNNLVTALSRVEVASSCYSSAIDTASERLKEKKVARNIFHNQLTVYRAIADEYQLTLKAGLPEISWQFIRSISRSRINYKNQWASHPTLEERTTHLEQVAMDVAPEETSAWVLFNDAEAIQESLTSRLYQGAVKLEVETQEYDAHEFDAWYTARQESYRLPAAYKGFYDKRYIDIAQWDIAALANEPAPAHFEALFNEENGQLQAMITGNEQDVAIVKAIKEKQIDVDRFDFDGLKYTIEDCDWIIKELEQDLQEQQERLQLADKQAFTFFYKHANGQQETLKAHYTQFKTISEYLVEYLQVVDAVMNKLQPFYGSNLTLEEVYAAVAELKQEKEPALKGMLKKITDEQLITPETPHGLYDKILQFLDTQYVYFIDKAFQNDELNGIRQVSIDVLREMEALRFREYKKMLEGQLEIYNTSISILPKLH